MEFVRVAGESAVVLASGIGKETHGGGGGGGACRFQLPTKGGVGGARLRKVIPSLQDVGLTL